MNPNKAKGNKMQDFYVYILQCSDGSFYVGHTDDIERRLNEHLIPADRATGIYSYVSRRLPFKLVFAEPCGKREEAQEAERMFKGWSRAKKEILIKEGWEAMPGICKKLRRQRLDKKKAE